MEQPILVHGHGARSAVPVRVQLYGKFTPLLVNTGNRLVNVWQKFGKQWELESLVKSKRTVQKCRNTVATAAGHDTVEFLSEKNSQIQPNF